MPDEWIQLVRKAKDSDRDFEALISKIEPVFLVVAGHMNGDISELVQVARIAVWNALPKVKLSKPATIRGFLLVAGFNKMKDVIRSERRKRTISCDDVDETVFAYDACSNIKFKGLLQEYNKYIIQNGRFCGAHKCLAKKKGISIWTMRRKFHQAVKLFLEELNQ